MSWYRAMTVAALALATAACHDAQRDLLAPEAPSVAASVTGSPQGGFGAAPVHHASGTVYLDWSVYGGGRDMYSFNATVNAAGQARGFFQAEYAYVDDEPGGFRFRADVVCLAVEGNDAWLGLKVVRTEDPSVFPVGTEAVVRVRDAGEGGHIGEPEDLDDLLGQNHDGIGRIVTTVSAASCVEKPRIAEFWLLLWIDRGNIQVR